MISDDLVQVLVDLGVDVRRTDGKEITGRCPVHVRVVGHEDRSPSWSMNATSGLWICFSCGARGTLSTLVSELMGDQDSILTVHRLLIDSSLTRMALPKDRDEERVAVDWVRFGKFIRLPDRMAALRNLDPDMAWRYGVRWDPDEKAWITPIVSIMGELLGWQAKKIGWVRNFPEGVKKSETLFGADRFTDSTVVLVESPLDVVRFAGATKSPQCVASFGATVSNEQIRMLSNMADRLIVALDNDDAGRAASKRLSKLLPNFRKGILWFNYAGTDAKDIGDMTDDQIKQGTESATIIPPWVLEKV